MSNLTELNIPDLREFYTICPDGQGLRSVDLLKPTQNFGVEDVNGSGAIETSPLVLTMAELECVLDSYIAKLDQAYESAWEVFTNREVRPSLRQLEAAYQFEFYLRRFRRLASSLPPWVLYGDALEPYSDVIALLEPAEKSGPRLCKAKKSPGGSEAPVM